MVKNQFRNSYQMLNNIIKDIDDKKSSFQLELANNNIKWQVGHIIVVNELFVFGTEEEGNVLGNQLSQYFMTGTSPQNFDGTEPSFEELKNVLNEQLERINNSIDTQLERIRQEAVIGMETFAETIPFAVIHMSNHVGQIKLMQTMIDKLDEEV